MRIGFISYPMLFQRRGGLQVQILESMHALNKLGVSATYIDVFNEKLEDFDVIHVFGAINGNNRIIEAAKSLGKPTVLSSVLHPPYTKSNARVDEILSSIIAKLTNWRLSTSYREINACLKKSDHVVALGKGEVDVLQNHGVLADNISTIPNGIGQAFHESSPQLFIKKFSPTNKVVISVASISPYKNQLTLAKAISDIDCHLYLIGDCQGEQQEYLQQCIEVAPGKVTYVGSLDYNDRLLPSAYAAADVFALPSQSEVMPISVLEALASGTPVVLTKNHGHDIKSAFGILKEVEPSDVIAIRESVMQFLSNPAATSTIKDTVSGFTWPGVASQLIDVYQRVLSEI